MNFKSYIHHNLMFRLVKYIVCRMHMKPHFQVISLLYIKISSNDSGTFYLVISDHISQLLFFIEVNILLQRKLKITTAQIILTSLGNVISGLLSGRDFSKFSECSAPTNGGAPLSPSGRITYFRQRLPCPSLQPCSHIHLFCC